MTETTSAKKPYNWLFWPIILVLGFLIILLMGYCAGQNDPKGLAKYGLEDNLKASLKDPKSAQFGSETIYEWQKGSYALCGTVNAKNSFGGYTGMSRFVSAGTVVMIEDSENEAVFGTLWGKVCHD